MNQFERKWNNTGGIAENADFVPLPPDAPKNPSPATGATGVEHHADTEVVSAVRGRTSTTCIIDTNSAFTDQIRVRRSGRDAGEDRDQHVQLSPCRAAAPPGTTYYWKVVGKTMALKTKTSAVWTFTTAGGAAATAAAWHRRSRALRVGGDADGGRVAGRVGLDRRRRREDAASQRGRREDHDRQRHARPTTSS